MVSFVSVFYHVYILSSLFQPTTTLDITFFFIQQLVRYKDIIVDGTRNNNNNHTANINLIFQNKNALQLIFQTLIQIISLLVRIFILLCILLVITLLEFVQTYHQSITKKTTTTITKEILSSPKLLPTPPSEKCEIVPITTLPIMDCDEPIKKDNDEDTAVTPAPSEPTPPDHKLESKQQQTTPIVIHHHDSLHQNEKSSFISQTDQLITDVFPSSTDTTSKDNMDINHKISESPPTTITNLQNQPSSSQNEKLAVAEQPSESIVSEVPDHAPTPSSTSSVTTHDDDNTTHAQDYERPVMPPVPDVPVLPPLSPSDSLSSSLSTLAHTHSNNHHHQEKPLSPSHPLHTHHSTSRLHHAYIEKQQQQQQQQQPQQQQHVAPLPRPYSSYSTRSHHSETPAVITTTTTNSPELPQPQGSSLSMKLNKLKKPGRRLSQLFKKKNKTK